ncbi:MAG: hypothetical protein M1829_002365 [Trizodia sp. TS-e1964]|nr:MAG: hypothetical protein M1829_002365 [Trizodia sp. TS-e1964]
MDELLILPSTVYQPPGSKQASSWSLSTILENERASLKAASRPASNQPLIISPFSDDFPTPRAFDSLQLSSMEKSGLKSPLYQEVTIKREFNDLYDVTDDESEQGSSSDLDAAPMDIAGAQKALRRLHARAVLDSAPSTPNSPLRKHYPSLIIPSQEGGLLLPGTKKSSSSPIPPTPPPKIPISPAVLSMLAENRALSISTPSLDGSLTSDQLASSDAPPTPTCYSPRLQSAEWDGNVQLHPDAMATLQFLSHEEIEPQSEQAVEAPLPEMFEAPSVSHRRYSEVPITPSSEAQLSDLSRLDIPSPGGFFASLGATSRNTWCLASAVAPSTTTAEQFYGCPWDAPVAQIIEVENKLASGPPTAMFVPLAPQEPLVKEAPTEDNIVKTEVEAIYDEYYQQELIELASARIDRTSLWLSGQASYLAALAAPPQESSASSEIADNDDISRDSVAIENPKTVRFSDVVEEVAVELPKSDKKESAFYHAFLAFINGTTQADAFMHREPRFDAVFTQRISSMAVHCQNLLGNYNLAGVNTAEDGASVENAEITRVEKEREAATQMTYATWLVMASKFLTQGSLIYCPAAKKLVPGLEFKNKSSIDRVRILDIGGSRACDWAWHCAKEFPNARVYTAYTRASDGRVSQQVRGPSNHRKILVPQLWKLPFSDGRFDVISARSLYALLKTDRPVEEMEDEYDLCLKECFRCLKPGGYIQFSLLDSDIVNAGPFGSKMSVEFGFNLRTRGYDSAPTRSWIPRLRKAGFGTIKRSWTFLPAGPAMPTTSATESSKAVPLGPSGDAAHITGLIGSLAWEKWMLKFQMENGKSGDQLLEGVTDVMHECRRVGAGWRYLNGWARKPFARPTLE